MARSVKCRRVCKEPHNRLFSPETGDGGAVTLSVDALEALRLCDLENLDQDAAAQKMGVSRGTFQRLLYAARKSVAHALCEGKGIRIQGGHYTVDERPCGHGHSCTSCPFSGQEEQSNTNSINKES